MSMRFTGLPTPGAPEACLSPPQGGGGWDGLWKPRAALALNPLPPWGRDRFCEAKPGLGCRGAGQAALGPRLPRGEVLLLFLGQRVDADAHRVQLQPRDLLVDLF